MSENLKYKYSNLKDMFQKCRSITYSNELIQENSTRSMRNTVNKQKKDIWNKAKSRCCYIDAVIE